MHIELFTQLAIIVGFTTVVGIILHFLKQPLVAAYLLAGVLISFFQLVIVEPGGPLEFIPTIGVAFLLFLIGIELDFREVKALGKPIVLASVGQMAVTTVVVALLMSLFGFGPTEAAIIGLAISFSSTIVVIKLLVDKQEVTTLHGKVAIGILLVEDLAAVVSLMFLSLSDSIFSVGITSAYPIFSLFLKATILFLLVYITIRFAIDKFVTLIAKNQELLFFSAIAWCFAFIAVATALGFSLEIGAFLGGVSLAASPYRYQIVGRLKPLRDFFIALFFIDLGMRVSYASFIDNALYIGIFSAIALLLKPFIFTLVLSALGFRRFTTYHASTTLSQISEFSVILVIAAAQRGIVNSQMVSVLAATTIITIFISSIFVNQNHKLYKVFWGIMGVFERKANRSVRLPHRNLKDHIILIGAHRAGEPVLTYLRERVTDSDLLIVDYNPQIVRFLEQEKIPVLFGDIADPDILDQLHMAKAKLVVSTIRELKDNLLVLETGKRDKSGAKFIMAATDGEEAELLYKHGADEVVVPLQLEGLRIVRSLEKYWQDETYFQKIKDKQQEKGERNA